MTNKASLLHFVKKESVTHILERNLVNVKPTIKEKQKEILNYMRINNKWNEKAEKQGYSLNIFVNGGNITYSKKGKVTKTSGTSEYTFFRINVTDHLITLVFYLDENPYCPVLKGLREIKKVEEIEHNLLGYTIPFNFKNTTELFNFFDNFLWKLEPGSLY